MANPSSRHSSPTGRSAEKNRPPDEHGRSRRDLRFVVCAAVLALAAAIRLQGARNDLWLDEILALDAARQVSSLWEIFTGIHSEINHHLYTAYLYFVAPGDNGWLCRLPSLAAGIGTVIMAGLIGRRRDPLSAFFAMLLTGFSYVLVLYSSEARGYSLAVFFAFLSLYLLDSYLTRKGTLTALCFSLAVVGGLLSQLTFLSFYLAALIWSAYRLLASRCGVRRFGVEMLACHAAPNPVPGRVLLRRRASHDRDRRNSFYVADR